jgi:hypothetical protein
MNIRMGNVVDLKSLQKLKKLIVRHAVDTTK